MNRRFGLVAGLTVVLLGSLYIGSPYYAANALKEAAIAGDVDTLDQGIDFPAVRESLKAEMTAALMAELQADPKMKDNPFAGFGAMMMPVIVDKAVGSFVTPEAIAKLAKGGKPGQDSDFDKPGTVDYKTEYSSLSRFRVHTVNPETGQSGPTFLFERQGLIDWKVIKIELPEGFLSNGDGKAG